MSYRHGNDSCLSIWADAYGSGRFDFPPHARVLEIGCAEADWQTPMLALRPDLQITGIDWRGCTRPGTTVQGDVLTTDFPPASVDAVVGISSIEHIGLGHYNSDPADPLGDRHCMERVASWLIPGGWAYLDVPFHPAGFWTQGTSHRVYDFQAIESRLIPTGLQLVDHWYADMAGHVVGKPPIAEPPAFCYIALLLKKV